ncbi:MAG: hypothetical protein OEL53_11495 [Rhodospirillales bacterium]|nr:hypothetical protein [Rhodospirillales bacterium]
MPGLVPRLSGLNSDSSLFPHPEERSVSKDEEKQGKCSASPFETAASRLPQGEALIQVLKARFFYVGRNTCGFRYHRQF